MADLNSVLIAIVHHTLASKKISFAISGDMISKESWTEMLAASQGELEQSRVVGNWALYSSLVHHALPVIPSQPQSFFEIIQGSILHPNVYTQMIIKTGVYAADEDPFNVAEDQVASNTFVLLCALLFKTNGPASFLSWFGCQFRPLLIVVEQAIAASMTHGCQFLVDQNQHCFPITNQKISHVGIPNGSPIFRSLALLRILRERLAPSVTRSPCPPRSDCLERLLTGYTIPSPALFATRSSLEREHNLRVELFSRRRKLDIDLPKYTTIRKQSILKTCTSRCPRRPLSDVANLPRAQH